MDQVALKSKGYADPVHTAQGARDAVASLGGLSVNFSDILAKAGRRIETNMNGLTEHADLARAQDRRDEPRPGEAYDTRRDDRPRDVERDAEHGTRADDRRDTRSDDHRPTHRDDRADHAADRRDAPSDHRRDDRPAANDTARPSSESAGGKHDSAVNADDKPTAEAGHDDKKHKKADGSENAEAAAKGPAKKSNQPNGDEAGLAAALKQQTEVTVAALLAQRNATQAEAGDAAGTKESRARGRGETGDNAAGTLAQLVRQAAGEKTQGQGQAKGGDQAAAQGTTGSTEGETADGAADAKAKNFLDAATNAKARQQAGEIADRIGDGNRVQVKVTSGNESQGIVSKPGAALTPTAVTADGQGQTPTAQAVAGNAQAQAQAQAQGQQGQGQAQAAGPQAAGDAKAQAAATTQPGAAAATGQGGDAPSSQNTNTVGQSNQAGQTAQAKNAEAAAHPRFQPFKQQVMEQVNVHVAKGLEAGKDKITINLKPAELGRIEVQMEVARDGRMVATITADNRDTLDLLQRDSRDLAKALQDAGMQTDSGNLQFNLREQTSQGRNGRDRAPSGPARIDNVGDVADSGPAASPYGGGIRADGRVDIRA